MLVCAQSYIYNIYTLLNMFTILNMCLKPLVFKILDKLFKEHFKIYHKIVTVEIFSTSRHSHL